MREEETQGAQQVSQDLLRTQQGGARKKLAMKLVFTGDDSAWKRWGSSRAASVVWRSRRLVAGQGKGTVQCASGSGEN